MFRCNSTSMRVLYAGWSFFFVSIHLQQLLLCCFISSEWAHLHRYSQTISRCFCVRRPGRWTASQRGWCIHSSFTYPLSDQQLFYQNVSYLTHASVRSFWNLVWLPQTDGPSLPGWHRRWKNTQGVCVTHSKKTSITAAIERAFS